MEGINLGKLIPWKKVAFATGGLILIAVWILCYGTELVGAHFASLKLETIVVIAALSFFWFFLQALAWNLSLGAASLSFWQLLKIKIGGEGLNMLGPFTLVGGDSVRFDLMKRQGIEAGAGSVVTDQAVQQLAIVVIIAIGLTFGVLALPELHPILRWGVPALTVVGLVVTVFKISRNPGSFFGALCSCPKTSPAMKGRVSEIDRHLTEFRRHQGGTFYQALLLHILAQGLKVGEIYVIGSVLLPTFSVALAFVLAALIPLVKGLFCFLPAALGIIESLFVGVFVVVLGAATGPAGLLLALIRRLRAFAWIVLGLVLVGNPFRMFLKKA